MVRMQLTHVYVQKSISTTFPRWLSRVKGSELIQLAMPVISGASSSSPLRPVDISAGASVGVGDGVAASEVGELTAVEVGAWVGEGWAVGWLAPLLQAARPIARSSMKPRLARNLLRLFMKSPVSPMSSIFCARPSVHI